MAFPMQGQQQLFGDGERSLQPYEIERFMYALGASIFEFNGRSAFQNLIHVDIWTTSRDNRRLCTATL